MFCTKCGTRLDDAARYCVACGQPTFTVGEPAAAASAGSPENTPGPPPLGTAPKRLRRIREGKKLAGVCTGFAEYFAMDVTLMRLLWVGLLLVPPNIGFFGYIICWIVLPKP